MGYWKACVLSGADRMGEVAANKFLKTLEEPPPRCLFFLLTERPEQLLPTIRSRCQSVQLQELDPAASAWQESLPQLLMGSAGGEAPRYAAAFGRADRLTALLKQVKEESEKMEKKAAKALDLELEDDVLEARASARYREARTSLMRTLLLWYRDLLLLVSGADVEGVYFREHAGWLQTRAQSLSYRAALRNCRIVERMYGQMEANMPDAAVLGWGFCRLS
jgi:DNA polymerase-3 subunit delta'